MRSPSRRSAIIAGAFFVLAAVSAVAALALYQPVLADGFVTGADSDGGVRWGALLEVLLAGSVVGTAVTLYPIVKRYGEGMALAYVAGRVVEAVVIVVGIISLLSIVSLRESYSDRGSMPGEELAAVASALVALHDWTFLLGPGLAIGVNTLLLATLMRRSRLVPAFIPIIGLVGGPLVFVSSALVLFGFYDQVSTVAGLAALPVTAWEMSLAVYLIVKGFRADAPREAVGAGGRETAIVG